MSTKDSLKLDINIAKIREEAVQSVEATILQRVTKLAETEVASDYELGTYIREHTRTWIRANLRQLVLTQLEQVDIKAKVDLAVERAVLDIVHNQLKTIKLF